MYHQFKELADIDITREDMEVGPTTHYIMGGIAVDAETQMSTVPGFFAAGECAAGINGANRLGGNSLSDLLVFGKRAGEHAAVFAKQQRPRPVDDRQVEQASRDAVAPFDRGAAGENPYKVQHDLQETMQDMVGIVRVETEMRRALQCLESLGRAPPASGSRGTVKYNRLAHCARPAQSVDRIRVHRTVGARAQRKPRRALSRGLSRQRSRVRPLQYRRAEGPRRRDAGESYSYSGNPGRTETDHRGEQMISGLGAWGSGLRVGA